MPKSIDRLSKVAMVAAIAVFFSLVVLNNLTDYAANFTYVQHIMSMDTVFPDNRLKWRAIDHPTVHHVFFCSIIAWEMLTAGLCWVGVFHLSRTLNQEAVEFDAAKLYAVLGLTSSLLMWLFAFLGVGGEWFQMWQSKDWNGQPIAFQMFTITSVVLLFLRQRDLPF